MNPVVTLGGVTVGLAAALKVALDWWPGRKAFTGTKSDKLNLVLPLMPFFWGFCYGVLVPLTLGGVLLGLGWFTVTAVSWLGDVALWAGVGSEMGSVATRASAVKLTPQANAMMSLLTCAVAWTHTHYVRLGIVCGLSLGLTSGVAGMTAVPLAQWLDRAAGIVYGAFA